eukprot:Blabericola_migrator_1__4623@NODE_2450_length_2741_cov_35_320120_g1534_i0_p3_GENE_NODE_2450_length_2741_cov_35_320120_g1534_i0NODE_2450_length_2741_cov_35_320120_g1534_i0_p3_ORF_typecomplete_len131_score32_08_NODE_2450_length_2741_cov_35_320120_g1534_i0267659
MWSFFGWSKKLKPTRSSLRHAVKRFSIKQRRDVPLVPQVPCEIAVYRVPPKLATPPLSWSIPSSPPDVASLASSEFPSGMPSQLTSISFSPMDSSCEKLTCRTTASSSETIKAVWLSKDYRLSNGQSLWQ